MFLSLHMCAYHCLIFVLYHVYYMLFGFVMPKGVERYDCLYQVLLFFFVVMHVFFLTNSYFFLLIFPLCFWFLFYFPAYQAIDEEASNRQVFFSFCCYACLFRYYLSLFARFYFCLLLCMFSS